MSTRSAPVYGTSQDDDIDKSSATSGQMINTLQGDDTVIGSEFADRIYLGSGDDSAQGGGGNDIVVGGDGTDTAVYRGSIFDFTWSEIRTDILEVTDNNTTNGDDGTDTLRGVEQLQFDDFLFVLGGANAAYLSGVTDQTTDEDSAKSFSFEAWDFDGGDVTIHSITGTSGGSFSVDGFTSLSSGMGVGKNFTVSFDPGADYQHLGFNESLIEQVEVVVSDGQGNLTTQTFQMTIDGVNDDPTIDGISNNNATVSEDGILSAAGVVTASDVDQNDSLTYAVVGGGTGTYGSLSIDANGEWTYNLDNSSAAVQALNAGPAVQDVFTIEVSDGEGGFAYEDITVNVQGEDDGIANGVFNAAFVTYQYGWNNSSSYQESMDAAFGAGQWDAHVGVANRDLFDGSYDFVWIDGSDSSGAWLRGYLNEYRDEIEAFVAEGGSVLINAGRNYETGTLDLGFGATLHREFSRSVTATDAAQDILTGPNGNADVPEFTGNFFGHDIVVGADLTQLLINEYGNSVLSGKAHGEGYAGLGGMTANNFHEPQPEADILEANILSFIASHTDDYAFIA